MIAFDLQCSNGHSFEGWFEDSRAYDTQKKKGLISCPVCNDTNVSKMLSRFSIKSSQPPAGIPQTIDEMAAISEKVVHYIKENFDDVGCNFTKEALKIHYGVSEPRNIRGVSTREEEKTLEKEGVNFIKFPVPMPSDTD